MGEILGTKPHEDERCLSCHAVVIKDRELLGRSKEVLFRVEDGVSCVVCHGAYKEWVSRHGVFTEVPRWRPLTRARKEQDFGMRDLWDPIRRTELCASCHVGTLRGGARQFVTHEMYAAGHPPLPGFEVASFSDQMPRHWQYRSEKKDPEVRRELGYDGQERERTKLLLVGAAVSFREAMRLLEDQAEECLKGTGPDSRALDLASYDCSACHYEVRPTSWRQRRGFGGKPGRVLMPAWPTALVRLAIHQAAADDAEARRLSDAFNRELEKLQSGTDLRPYGHPARIAPAARELARRAGELAERLNRTGCDPAAARRLLARAPDLYQGEALDYDSARQVAWAIRVMANDVNLDDPKVHATLKALDTQLALNLPVRLTSPKDRSQGSIVKALPNRLERLGAYDPDSFRRALLGLQERLGRNAPDGQPPDR
jgi:hypothetical protein